MVFTWYLAITQATKGAGMRVYIAGPINGMPNGNKEAFKLRAEELETQGHEPVNPWDVPVDHAGPCTGDPTMDPLHGYGCYMRKDLEALMTCDAISLLDGWEHSRGAMVEKAVAEILGMPRI
jgi:hypothetical protein